MSIDKITAQLGQFSNDKERKMPPVELWDPPYCGEIDITIKLNGDWTYNGSVFKRMALVKLFASVLKKEADEYFLVTPVEKVKIQVEQSPFLLTKWAWQDNEQTQMLVCTNLDDEFMVNDEHPVVLDESGELYITVRRNLMAKVHRNVFYQWVEAAREVKTNKGTELVLRSANIEFSLGVID